MTSKYWTAEENKGLMVNCNNEMKLNEQSQKENDTMSYSESIEENVVTVKANNMSENENKDANHHDASKSFEMYRSSHIKQRPDSLKLSFTYGSSTDLGKSVFSNSNVNQTKSLSVDGNKSHHGGKKSTSYDLWVNENASKVVNVSDGECKKLDLPGRVSFSTNDVYEIDYSDTESSQTSGNVEKLNKSLDEQQIQQNHRHHQEDDKVTSFSNTKRYVKEHYMESNSDNELDELDYRYRKENEKSFKLNQIIDDYKTEVATINHRMTDKATTVSTAATQLNNLRNKQQIIDSNGNKLNQSMNPVIKKYLKAKEQEIGTSNENYNNSVSNNRKINDLSKKSKNLKDLTKPTKHSNTFGKASSATTGHNRTSNGDKMKKPPKSPSTGLYGHQQRQDSTLDEFQIEKVVSWMSVNEDNFSELDFNIIGGGSGIGTCHINDNNKEVEKGKDESTYQEIVSFIKEIEHDRKDTEDFKALKTDVEFKLNTILNSMASPENEMSITECTDTVENANIKLKEIFSYLDKVDSTCDKALIEMKGNNLVERENVELEFALEPDVIEDVPKISDLLMLPNHQLARRIVKLSLRANELSNAIQLSKEHVGNVRNDKAKALRLEKLNGQNRLKEQKKHYEEIVARHQTFIEQLIKDKGSLCEKVSQITRRLDSQNQAWEHRLKTEIEKVKEQTLAGEKIRREKWVRDNTKKIKELTVKGLEMEINKMSSNHKQEIDAIKRQHQLDVMKAIEETKEKYEKSEKAIRESYAEERELAIERERRAIKERFEKQLDDERKSAEQQRIRMIHDFEMEKERLYSEIREKEHQFEMKKDELINERIEMLEDAKESYDEKFKQRESKHQMELNKIQEQYETDFKIWKREFENKMKLRESEKENLIREQNRLERDRQIDAIISKMDMESTKNQQDYEGKLNRMKEKYEHEIREVENSEKVLKDKYIETRTRLAESEANTQNLKAMVTQMELQLNHLTKLCEKYTAEKDNLKEEARSEIKTELQTINKEHEMEIQRIYSRVQQAIQKKDATLEVLQKENAAMRERNLKMDAIIRQQRKDYCTK
ncbi:centrosomal protein of 131 kDa isoform X2 [Chironomus tepperi]